jgi:hypothetical protein
MKRSRSGIRIKENKMNWNRSGKSQADALTHIRYTYFVEESTTSPVLIGVTLRPSSGVKKHVSGTRRIITHAAAGKRSINGSGAAGIEQM